jgi:hypothetical protein
MEELSIAQIKKLSKVIALDITPLEKLKLIILIQAMSLPLWKRLKFHWFYFFQSSTFEKADLLLCAETLFHFDQLIVQKLKKIGGTFVLLHGPSDGLSNCTFWEFIVAEKHYFNYLKNADPKDLDLMIAALYRTKKKNYLPHQEDDIRIPYSESALAYSLQIVQGIDQDSKVIILKYFDSCRNHLAKSFPMVFQKPKEQSKKGNPLEDLQKAGSSNKSSQGSWLALISELATDMEDYDKIGKTNLYIALMDISHRIRKSNEAKKQASKKR